MKNIMLGAVSDGTRVEADIGDTLIIRLPENPTTGHLWQLTADSAALGTLADSSFEAPAPLVPGAGGERVLTFKIHTAGTARLRLLRKRPWEGDETALEAFTVDLVAKP